MNDPQIHLPGFCRPERLKELVIWTGMLALAHNILMFEACTFWSHKGEKVVYNTLTGSCWYTAVPTLHQNQRSPWNQSSQLVQVLFYPPVFVSDHRQTTWLLKWLPQQILKISSKMFQVYKVIYIYIHIDMHPLLYTVSICKSLFRLTPSCCRPILFALRYDLKVWSIPRTANDNTPTGGNFRSMMTFPFGLVFW